MTAAAFASTVHIHNHRGVVFCAGTIPITMPLGAGSRGSGILDGRGSRGTRGVRCPCIRGVAEELRSGSYKISTEGTNKMIVFVYPIDAHKFEEG